MTHSPLPDGMVKTPFFDATHIIGEDAHAFVYVNQFPVSQGHVLVIPKREVISFFDLTDIEIVSHRALAHRAVMQLKKHYAPDGFNIGWNDGIAGGQLVAHAHMHIIPRYHAMNAAMGITSRGGIVNIIPDRPSYYDADNTGRNVPILHPVTLSFDRI